MKANDSILGLLTRSHPPSPIYDFAALRVAAIIASYGWLSLTPLSQPQRGTVTLLLYAFTLYCILLYAWIVTHQEQMRRLNLLVLVIDLGFSLVLIRLTGGVESPFFLALYLIAALQAYYYGLRRGVAVLVSSSCLYVMTIWPTWQPTSASIVSLRLGFIILVVVPLVILSERERRGRRELEAVNRELEEDVTRRVALERQVRQAEKLSALGTLSAGLAHEINNPLGIITSRVELALMDAHETEVPKQFIDDLKVIEKHAQRAARVARGLLSFSRPATGQLLPLDLNGVIEETLLLIEGQLEKEQIVLERRLAPSLPKVMGNVSQLEEVLLNLFTNARDAMTAGGRIRVESRLAADEASVQILIADTGEGIPDVLVQQIFDPFFTTKKTGTGLGLSISYGIVKEHRGRLDVHSEAGKGATFIMTLPAGDV
ncbi:MAG: hypothetical protein KGL31_04345 [candidate division NC10 bacterium]|nr:hypothetical protein [candidate division NC10 bacterium]MDE2321133.1 hypothetical protein [candidate division NC10 bacterium]